MSNGQKLHYLKANCIGDAADLIKSFPIMDANYAQAWNILETRYHNKRFIVDIHLKSLFGITSLASESSMGLRKVLDTALESVRQLTAMGLPVDEWDVILVFIIVGKLDCETRRQWELTLDRNNLPTFSELTTFIENRWQSLEMASFSNVQSNNPHKKSTTTFKHNPRSFLTTSSSKCQICGEDHLVFKCAEFLETNYKEGTLLVREKDLCFNCLRPGHTTSKCKSTSCKYCGKGHHSLLHLHLNDGSNQQNTSQSSHITNEAVKSHLVHGSSGTLLATAIVLINNDHGNQYPVRALLDSGSQVSFITKQLQHSLG